MRAKPGEELTRKQWPAEKIMSAGTKCIERSNEVTAIDRRNEWCIAERLKCLRIVPVVQMAAIFFESRNCSETAIRKCNKLRHCQESELAGSLPGIE